jgi:hypothetical protein
MRFMSIPPFPRKIEIPDFDFFVRSRLNQTMVLWPEQATPLVGYMGWPNDPDGRAASVAIVRGWFEGSRAVPRRLRQIQTDWARIADISHVHRDLTEGGHQRYRGGPSIGKAIAVVAGSIRARGAHAANLWRAWKEYKDVAHLVTAATIITDEVRRLAKIRPLGELGLGTDRLGPFTIAMMMPDFVLSLAMSFQEYGLSSIPQSREQPMLDPENLWRIAPDMNVVAVPPLVRTVTNEAIAILKVRRAGNRGKAKRSETTPVTTGTGISAPAPASGAATAEYGMPDGAVVNPAVNDGATMSAIGASPAECRGRCLAFNHSRLSSRRIGRSSFSN